MKEVKFSDTKPKLSQTEYEQMKCNDYNSTVGALNEFDGVECSKCLNKGAVMVLDGIYSILVDCDCMIKRNSIMIAKKSGMNTLLNHRLKKFKTDEPYQSKMKQLAEDYIKEDSKNFFALLGQSGCGKTMLCSCIANYNIYKNRETRYVSWVDLMAKFKDDLDKVEDMMYSLKRVNVLYIDDLFKGKVTDWVVERAYELINYRYNNNLTTIISSEYLIDDLMKIDQATIGRIVEKAGEYLIEIEKDDNKNYRIKENK